jgi:hypothetical protein
VAVAAVNWFVFSLYFIIFLFQSPQCAQLIDHLKSNSPDELVEKLKPICEWQPQYGKSHLARWVHILDQCDQILSNATKSNEDSWQMAVDATDAYKLREATIVVLRFTALLFDNTFGRSMYNSAEVSDDWMNYSSIFCFQHLLALLDSSTMRVVVEVLRLFYVIGKRTKYVSQKLSENDQKRLTGRLCAIAEVHL